MWKVVDELSCKSRCVYNDAMYITRQWFINNNIWIRSRWLDKLMQLTSNSYYDLGTQSSQGMVRLIEKNWKSYFVAIKDWAAKDGKGYSGKPKLPGYKKKDGRAIVLLKPAMCYIKNNEIYFAWEPLRKFTGIKTNIKTRIIETRFVPQNSCYWMEFVYRMEVPEIESNHKNIIGIDLGVSNFATISNNTGAKPIIINGRIITSINHQFNKTKAEIQSKTKMVVNNRIKNLTDKRSRRLDYLMHTFSRFAINYCKENNIGTIVLGKNDGWKDGLNIGHKNNQIFEDIPYLSFINKLTYKCENEGINLIKTEESYTSGTSFIDNELPVKDNYNKTRKKKRGLFISNDGIKINADLNASYQIVKKVLPNAFEQRDIGYAYYPVRLTISNKAYQDYRYA